MLRRIRTRLTYANVMATVAVFLALGGGAYAAATVGSGEVVNNSLQHVDLKDGNGVRTEDVRDDSLAGGGLVAADLRPSAVRKSEIASGAVTIGNLQSGSSAGLSSSDLAPNVPAGACAPKSFGISIADRGEVPLLTTTNSVPGLTMIPGAVMEDGKLIVLFCNASASPIDPSNGGFSAHFVAP